jgi:hypothetical protein
MAWRAAVRAVVKRAQSKQRQRSAFVLVSWDVRLSRSTSCRYWRLLSPAQLARPSNDGMKAR